LNIPCSVQLADVLQVIIMGILNEAGDKMLLGRQNKWPKGETAALPVP
jgi:NAD+ diphosphatase